MRSKWMVRIGRALALIGGSMLTMLGGMLSFVAYFTQQP